MALIVIDAGHGGFDNGAMYQGRKEKDDNLRLALAVGNLLKQRGYQVVYTRTEDEYQSPYEKAQIANEAGADYFISFHRNSGENDNTYNGAQTLVYDKNSRAMPLAESIQRELVQRGFADLGIEERTGLVVLRRTEMPAVLIEAGFINHDKDNRIFDEDFYGVANAIADGIENAIPLGNRSQEVLQESRQKMQEEESEPASYGVEVGRSMYDISANYLAQELMSQGFTSYVYEEEGMLHVIVGRVGTLEEAVALQQKLRLFDYPTMIVSSRMEQKTVTDY
ncbi:MAG: N-acetylmuramoyl-L-alanine amidase [Roseburia sp.]|nr:N-acetylmuramoyl-L-alanine amidase [Roseburia sp.]